ncbi:MAG TPA: helix-turn-helix domain-containing protein [Acidimicrobiales bacterium]
MSGPVNAVVTTGIYCRDGCPASPDPVNVRTYPMDASAEHDGFRPCLKCRPDGRAPPVNWRGVPELVDHALHEICHGALDYSTESELASLLGVSSRHLRRLFTEHLGVTPTQIGISRRTHFARRLVDETDLPVAQIAFAAGFGSVRSFNSSFKQIFHFTPTELRAKRRHSDQIPADGGIALTLEVAPTPDTDTISTALSTAAISGVEHASRHAYQRTIVLAGHAGAIRVDWTRPEALRVEAHLPRFDRLIEVASRVRRLFDPTLDPRVFRGWTDTETAVKQLLVEELGPAATRTILSEVAHRHGTDLLPIRPLGLTHTNADYEKLSARDWLRAGVPVEVAERCHAAAQTKPATPRGQISYSNTVAFLAAGFQDS